MSKYLIGCEDVVVKVYPECKYTYAGEAIHKVTYKDVEAFSILHHCKEAEAIEEEMIANGLGADTNGEYLILHFKNGDTATFRNSFVDMFYA